MDQMQISTISERGHLNNYWMYNINVLHLYIVSISPQYNFLFINLSLFNEIVYMNIAYARVAYKVGRQSYR